MLMRGRVQGLVVGASLLTVRATKQCYCSTHGRRAKALSMFMLYLCRFLIRHVCCRSSESD